MKARECGGESSRHLETETRTPRHAESLRPDCINETAQKLGSWAAPFETAPSTQREQDSAKTSQPNRESQEVQKQASQITRHRRYESKKARPCKPDSTKAGQPVSQTNTASDTQRETLRERDSGIESQRAKVKW